jgi:hypothetical protein
MRLFIFVLLLVLGFVSANQPFSSPRETFNKMKARQSDPKMIEALDFFQNASPLLQDKNTAKNSVLSAPSDDASCNTAMCSLNEDLNCVYEEFLSAFSDDGTDLTWVADCFTDCMGLYWECGNVLADECSYVGMNTTSCTAQGLGDDDDSSSSWTSSSSNSSTTWTSSTWTSTDDTTSDVICGDDCLSTYYGGYVNAMSVCGPSFFDANDTDLVVANIFCTTNDDGDYCLDMLDSLDMYVNCSWLDTQDSSICSDITSIGCCAASAMLFAPACFNEFASSNCDVSITDMCTDGMFVDMEFVSSSMEFDSYMDLDDEDTGYMISESLADSLSFGDVELSDSLVSINSWSGSSARKLRSQDRKLAASTSFDYSVNLVGTYTSSSDVVSNIESSTFTNRMQNDTGVATVTTTSTPSVVTIAPTVADDAAFSAPLNMVLVLTSMLLGLSMFF